MNFEGHGHNSIWCQNNKRHLYCKLAAAAVTAAAELHCLNYFFFLGGKEKVHSLKLQREKARGTKQKVKQGSGNKRQQEWTC